MLSIISSVSYEFQYFFNMLDLQSCQICSYLFHQHCYWNKWILLFLQYILHLTCIVINLNKCYQQLICLTEFSISFSRYWLGIFVHSRYWLGIFVHIGMPSSSLAIIDSFFSLAIIITYYFYLICYIL